MQKLRDEMDLGAADEVRKSVFVPSVARRGRSKFSKLGEIRRNRLVNWRAIMRNDQGTGHKNWRTIDKRLYGYRKSSICSKAGRSVPGIERRLS